MKINITTSISLLKEIYSSGMNNSFLFPKIEKLEESDLLLLIRKHYKQDYFDLMISEILLYHNFSDEWIRNLYFEFQQNKMMVQEIIMCGKAPIDILDIEKKSTDNIISEYAQIGILRHHLKKSNTVNDFLKLYYDFQGDSMLDYSAKYHIASYPYTPKEVLKIMLNDKDEEIIKLAKDRLNQMD